MVGVLRDINSKSSNINIHISILELKIENYWFCHKFFIYRDTVKNKALLKMRIVVSLNSPYINLCQINYMIFT